MGIEKKTWMKLYSFFNLNCEIDISYKDTMSEKR